MWINPFGFDVSLKILRVVNTCIKPSFALQFFDPVCFAIAVDCWRHDADPLLTSTLSNFDAVDFSANVCTGTIEKYRIDSVQYSNALAFNPTRNDDFELFLTSGDVQDYLEKYRSYLQIIDQFESKFDINRLLIVHHAKSKTRIFHATAMIAILYNQMLTEIMKN